jgi:hypothetical protein
VWALLLLTALSGPVQGLGSTAETIATIQVHGNTLTSDAEVLRLAAVQPGMPFEAGTIAEVADRLRASNRFKRVQVLKRFASISDPTEILIVIIVDEGAVHIEMTGDPSHPTRVVRNRLPRLLVLPVLGADEVYGATYGLRLALPDPAGKRSRIGFPLTWGGVKQAALEFEKSVDAGPIDRVTAGVSISRVTNPFFEETDDRVRLWARGERELLGHALRAGAIAGWERAAFMSLDDRFIRTGGDIIVDTRVDPALPRNAVYGRAAWEHLSFPRAGINRLDLDGRGYIGLFRQNVLTIRALRRDADQRLPPYLQPLLGGLANVRGFRAGTAAGDTLVAGSAEVIIPLSPSLSFGRIGLSTFTDAGAAYDKAQRLADQPMKVGYGAGVWLTAAFVHLNVAVAHGRGSSTRLHVGGDITF